MQTEIKLEGMLGTIDWGDSNETSVVTADLTSYTHDYAGTGTYTVKIIGELDTLTALYNINSFVMISIF